MDPHWLFDPWFPRVNRLLYIVYCDLVDMESLIVRAGPLKKVVHSKGNYFWPPEGGLSKIDLNDRTP